MRILIFGDIHGNLVALEKMLYKAGREVDMLVCHGDVVNYGPWSNECVQLLQSLTCTQLLGNHEEFFLSGVYTGENTIAKAFFKHCYSSFKERDVISSYGNSVVVGDFKVQHTVNNQYVFPDTNLNKLKLDRNYIIGHSHHQFCGVTNAGFKLINTGSVGQNRKFINLINYVIYDTSSTEVKLEALVYNVDLLIDKMIAESYPQICLEYYLQKERI